MTEEVHRYTEQGMLQASIGQLCRRTDLGAKGGRNDHRLQPIGGPLAAVHGQARDVCCKLRRQQLVCFIQHQHPCQPHVKLETSGTLGCRAHGDCGCSEALPSMTKTPSIVDLL